MKRVRSRRFQRIMLDRLRRKKKPKGPAIPRSEFLKFKPVRNPALEWKKNEKGVIELSIPLNQESTKKGIFSKLLPPPPKEKKIRLDKVGSIVWELCDGNTTVKDIVGTMCERYKMMPVEAELSLDAYFKQLSKRGLVGFSLPEELREKFKDETKDLEVKK